MIQVASCSSFVTSCIVRGKYEIRTLPSPSQFLFLEAEALVTRDHGAGALLGLLTLPISQKEMQNRTTLDTILLLITSFVYTYANVSFRRRRTQYLYLVHARLPEHGGHLSDRSRAAAENNSRSNSSSWLGCYAPIFARAEGIPSREGGQ